MEYCIVLTLEWWKPHFSRGLALRAAERHDEALNAFQTAYNLLPDDHVRAVQCAAAIRDTNAARTKQRRRLSMQALSAIEQLRANPQHSNRNVGRFLK